MVISSSRLPRGPRLCSVSVQRWRLSLALPHSLAPCHRVENISGTGFYVSQEVCMLFVSEVSPEPTTSYSPFQMQMFSNKPEGLVGVDMAGSPPAGQRVKKGGSLGLGKLPSPVELMGRKKKGRTGGAAQGSQVVQPRVAAVLQHIGDLRRRQSSIDQLKQGSWWGSKPRCKAEEGHSQRQAEDSSMTISITVEKQDEATDYLSPTLTRPYTQQEGLLGGFEQASHLAPGGNPMMSFVLATADRQAKGGWQGPRLSHNEFWGIGHTPEE
ncbi:tumor necrosis factor ligand superfamily member 13 isoform X2 [Salvelinus fontinalis]|uniref:tumor necrosis factor ligand superfamily member 13 isoform X2 n=1 Tax=Salvelinus fontinalis TaxID=8038 RepID=UPI0024853BD2|nr:tumor necrosis factor ligand superfamily member 13 isoform X2 [Salvelinus fontinalis]